MRNIKDISGNRYGRLIVLGDSGKRKYREVVWKCLCDCGNIVNIQTGNLRSGKSTSCGCFQKECVRNLALSRITHGESHTRLYKIWCHMMNRCHNNKNSRYKDYGGRDIYVSKEWHDFLIFKAWALSNGYQENLTIERLNVDDGYNKDNCTWITRCQQARNKRNSCRYKGILLLDWCNIYNINYSTVKSRIYLLGWDTERAITTPVVKNLKDNVPNNILGEDF